MLSKNAQAYIKQRHNKLEKEISLKAGVDNIISAINLSQEGVSISGEKIDLTGAVSVNDNVTIDEQGRITAIDGTFSGTITGSTFSAEGESLSDAKITISMANGNYKTTMSPCYFMSENPDMSKYTRISDAEIELIYGDYGYRNVDIVAGGYGGYIALYNLNTPPTETIIAKGSTGNITCVSLTQTSDRNAKDDIEHIPTEKAVDFILNLRPVSFKFKGMDGVHHGFIAQEVEEISDWGIVGESDNGTKNLAYNEIIADLVATVQHLAKRVEALEEKING